jgi:hypothetical protein
VTGQTGLRRFVRPPAGTAEPAPASASASPPVTASQAAPPETAAAAGPAAGGQQAPAPERCELCATEVAAEHGHIADLEAASLLCACRACYLLFTRPGAGTQRAGAQTYTGRYRAVPDRYLADPDRPMTAADFDQLEVPVGLAFFLHTSREGGGLTGFYPSPAGATECRLELARWERLVADYPLLGEPESDVEAALLSRSDSGVEYFLVPVDACYELAGRMRLSWRGFDGGTEARQSIAAFLADVRQRARPFARSDARQEGQRG